MNTEKMREAIEKWVSNNIKKEFDPINIDDVYAAFEAGAKWQAARAGGDGEAVEFTCHGNSAPAYSCNKPGDMSGTYYTKPPTPSAKVPEITIAGRRFLAATEKLADWLNGCDISADHADRCPEDFNELCDAMVDFRAALSAAPTPEGGE